MLVRQPNHIHNLLTKPINGKSSSRSGFTLVELSIVLVIIGLLIGGILVGQSLIESAKINRFIKDVQSYDIAVYAFKEKFKALPGDSRTFGCFSSGGTHNVCDDGIIQPTNGGVDHFNSEVANFWKNLTDTQMLPNSYSNDVSAGIVMGVNIPKIEIGLGTGLIALYSVPCCGLTIHTNKNVFVAAYLNNANSLFGYNSTTVRPSMKPLTAMAIDQKMDDGNAFAGNVQGLGGRHSPVYNGITAGRNPYLYAPASSQDNCATLTNYSPHHSNESCGLSIVIGSQAAN